MLYPTHLPPSRPPWCWPPTLMVGPDSVIPSIWFPGTRHLQWNCPNEDNSHWTLSLREKNACVIKQFPFLVRPCDYGQSLCDEHSAVVQECQRWKEIIIQVFEPGSESIHIATSLILLQLSSFWVGSSNVKTCDCSTGSLRVGVSAQIYFCGKFSTG